MKPLKKGKVTIGKLKTQTSHKGKLPMHAPQRFLTKSVEELNFAEPEHEFEHIKDQVNDVMKQFGLNYSWERTGKTPEKSAYLDTKMRFSDAGSANNSLENPYALGGTLKSNMFSNASHDMSFESKASGVKSSKKEVRDIVGEIDRFIASIDEKADEPYVSNQTDFEWNM